GSNNPIDIASVLVYPNPANDRVWVQVEDAELRQVQLYDMLGKCAMAFEAAGNAMEIELKEVPGGLYLLRLETNRGWLTEKLMVKPR
ncbi:MAG: T9SS type A sorting domain-containing protein, partial [Saprospiraceae bacterium]